MNELFSIVYVSAATRPIAPAELELLLQDARDQNRIVGVTGLLLYADGNFMQVLEGPRKAVQDTFARIQRSSRHRQVIELMSETLERREFSEWSMAFSQAQAAQFLALRSAAWQAAPHGGGSAGRELLSQFWSNTR